MLMMITNDNKLWTCTSAEAQEASGVNSIPPMHAMRARQGAHPGMTLHCLKTKFRMNREDVSSLISIAMIDESTKKLFVDSKF